MKISLIKLSVFTLLILTIGNSPSYSDDTIITDDLILKQNSEMESFIQARDPLKTISFMHEHIADNAEFKISFNNRFMEGNDKPTQIMMNKADFINSYVRGLNYVDNYKINIKTKNINISDDGRHAMAEEVITEEGNMLNPNQPNASGTAFKTYTSCTKLYTLYKGVAVSNKADCRSETVKIGAV